MKPNYENAARKAYDTRTHFGLSDPLQILRQLSNVLVITFSFSDMPVDQDAFTCVDGNKFIIFYNDSLSPVRLRSVLARELGHVILQHDGKDPEEIWDEEATCYAYHFLCPPPSACVEIKFRPKHAMLSWSFKDMRIFSSLHALKEAIADEQTRIAKYIGHHVSYTPDDVEIRNLNQTDIFGHWNNYSSVIVGGKPVGFCGE